MPHLNHSSPVVDPSIYGYGGQKRSLDEGGKIDQVKIWRNESRGGAEAGEGEEGRDIECFCNLLYYI